jgi:hypothetical protein
MSSRSVRMLLAAATAFITAACGGVDVIEDVRPMTLADRAAGNPTAALGPGDTAYVAWIETQDDVQSVYVARLDAAGRGAPVRVNDVPGDAAPHDQAPPQVATGPNGAVYVAWQNNVHVPGRRFPASNLRFARSRDGGRTFEPAIFVNDDAHDAPSSHTFHDIAVAPDGTIHISWIDGRERTRAESAAPRHAAPAGHHGMHAGDLPGSDVRVATSVDGGATFNAGVVVHRNVCPCCRTALAVSRGGRLAVSFRSADRDIRDIHVALSDDSGQTFGAPLRVHEDGWQVESCPHAGAALAFDRDGALHVAWYTGAESRQGLWYARLNGDAGFGEPAPLLAGGWVPASQVKLAADPAGRVWIVWDDRRAEEPTVHVALADAAGVRALPFTASGRSPAVAAGDRVLIAWQDGDGAAARVLRYRE